MIYPCLITWNGWTLIQSHPKYHLRKLPVGELISKITSCHVQVRSTWPLLQCAIDRPGTAYPHCLVTRPIADGHDCIQKCFSFRTTSAASVMNTRDMQCSIARCRDSSSVRSEGGKQSSCSLCSVVDTLPVEPQCHRQYAEILPSRRRDHLKCDGTRAETRFRLSAKGTSPFKSAGASVQSTTGSRVVRISSY